MSEIEIRLNKETMLSGHVLTLSPSYVLLLGGIAEALVYSQIEFLTIDKKNNGGRKPVRISYSRLESTHFPFYGRRWIINIIARLETLGVIAVTRTGRVNLIEIREATYDQDPPSIFDGEAASALMDELSNTTSGFASMQVSVRLACKVGVTEAIVLQQIHIRHHGKDGSYWVIRSLEQWHSNVFMFLGLSTVKRIFSHLKMLGLIFVEKHLGEDGVVNCYRVNYIRLAELLEIDVPKSVPPASKKWSDYSKGGKWVDQCFPVKPAKKNAASLDLCIKNSLGG